jgi:O-antigen/teichoic acid export membrane protein
MISFVAVSMTYVYGTLLTAGGHLKLFNILAFLGLVINFSLNLFLIPHYKAAGATWATLITQFFIAGVQMYLVYRKYHFKVVIKDTFKLMSYTALLIVFCIICVHFHLPFIPSAVIISLSALVLFLVLKIIPLNAYQLFLKKGA